MRVSCLFVTVAVMFAGQNNALPIDGLPNLPVLGSEAPLVNKATGTLDTVPIVGGLTDGLLGGKKDGSLLKVKVNNSILRRQGLPVVSTVGGLVNGVETLPLIGGVKSIAPVTEGVTSKLGPLNGVLPNDNTAGSLDSVAPVAKGVTSEVKPLNADLPNVKKITTKTDKAIPASSLDGTVPSILKRESLPLVGSLPGVGGLTSLPGLDSMPALPLALPSLSSVPVIGGLGSAL